MNNLSTGGQKNYWLCAQMQGIPDALHAVEGRLSECPGAFREKAQEILQEFRLLSFLQKFDGNLDEMKGAAARIENLVRSVEERQAGPEWKRAGKIAGWLRETAERGGLFHLKETALALSFQMARAAGCFEWDRKVSAALSLSCELLNSEKPEGLERLDREYWAAQRYSAGVRSAVRRFSAWLTIMQSLARRIGDDGQTHLKPVYKSVIEGLNREIGKSIAANRGLFRHIPDLPGDELFALRPHVEDMASFSQHSNSPRDAFYAAAHCHRESLCARYERLPSFNVVNPILLDTFARDFSPYDVWASPPRAAPAGAMVCEYEAPLLYPPPELWNELEALQRRQQINSSMKQGQIGLERVFSASELKEVFACDRARLITIHYHGELSGFYLLQTIRHGMFKMTRDKLNLVELKGEWAGIWSGWAYLVVGDRRVSREMARGGVDLFGWLSFCAYDALASEGTEKLYGKYRVGENENKAALSYPRAGAEVKPVIFQEGSGDPFQLVGVPIKRSVLSLLFPY